MAADRAKGPLLQDPQKLDLQSPARISIGNPMFRQLSAFKAMGRWAAVSHDFLKTHVGSHVFRILSTFAI